MNAVKKFVKQLKTPYGLALLKLGKGFKGRLATKGFPELVAWAEQTPPQFQQCYYNAQKFVLDNPGSGYVYHEGYWQWHGGPYPVHHGWLVRKGKVVDFTAELCDLLLGKGNPAEDEYFGMPVPKERIFKMLLKKSAWGMISPDYALEAA